MKLYSLKCGTTLVGYRFVVGKYAYDCFNLIWCKSYGVPKASHSLQMTMDGYCQSDVTSGLRRLMVDTESMLANLVWTYTHLKTFDFNKTFKFKPFNNGYVRNFKQGALVKVGDWDFANGRVCVMDMRSGEGDIICLTELENV